MHSCAFGVLKWPKILYRRRSARPFVPIAISEEVVREKLAVQHFEKQDLRLFPKTWPGNEFYRFGVPERRDVAKVHRSGLESRSGSSRMEGRNREPHGPSRVLGDIQRVSL